jgi:RNA polymerase sigma factor (sigma-70 family)
MSGSTERSATKVRRAPGSCTGRTAASLRVLQCRPLMAGTEPLAGQCRRAAGRVLARHGWSLEGAAGLAEGAQALLAPSAAPTDEQAERACVQAYALCLYDACRRPERQADAYRELHAYLYRIARRRRPELAEDAAQEAIELVFRKIDTCADPRAFLKFAIYQLLTAFHRLLPRHEAPPPAAEPDDDREPVSATADAPPASDPESAAEARVRAAELLAWLRGVFAENPRARKQLLAVTMKHLEGRDDAEIARELDTTVANVHVLRSRGLEKLRAERERSGLAGAGSRVPAAARAGETPP